MKCPSRRAIPAPMPPPCRATSSLWLNSKVPKWIVKLQWIRQKHYVSVCLHGVIGMWSSCQLVFHQKGRGVGKQGTLNLSRVSPAPALQNNLSRILCISYTDRMEDLKSEKNRQKSIFIWNYWKVLLLSKDWWSKWVATSTRNIFDHIRFDHFLT